MNREALPLIFAILIPIILVSLIILYFYGYDVTLFLREIDIKNEVNYRELQKLKCFTILTPH